jgi:hypothetical protein
MYPGQLSENAFGLRVNMKKKLPEGASGSSQLLWSELTPAPIGLNFKKGSEVNASWCSDWLAGTVISPSEGSPGL